MHNRRFRPVVWVFVVVVSLVGLQHAMAVDCNRNGIPDHCDATCSLPGCLQYACGRSDDSDGNGVPDECEGVPAAGSFSTTADFTTLGTLINLDESVPDQLSRSELPSPMPNLWVAASNRGTIVRIDTRTGAILGEYRTSPDGRDANPSRTAVNLDGEVWVANSADGSEFGFGSITRIGVLDGGTLVPPTACEPGNRATFAPPFVYNTCVDRNGDGMITTSNGLIPMPWAFENTNPPQFGTVDTPEDECIISYVPVNGRNAAHLAVNKDNDVWVGGNHRNNTFDLVDGDTGAILETFDVGVGGHGGIIACNDVLWSVSKTGLPGVFWYDTNQDITASVCCTPDILADSNNDLEINEQDQLVENVSPGFIAYVNEDDENLNGTPDIDESPVGYEDDLAEVQLFTGCSPEHPLAWWSLSWPDSAPGPDPIKIWFFSDKSDGELPVDDPNYPANAVAGVPIINYDPLIDNIDAKYPWPPPASVWVEAIAPYDDLALTFSVQAEPSEPILTQTVKASGKGRKNIFLRVVMVVEPGAPEEIPPNPTGGCKLKKSQVQEIVRDMVRIPNTVAPGVTIHWSYSGNFEPVERLESRCMVWPIVGNTAGCAGLGPAHVQNNDPRRTEPQWYTENIVDQGAGQDYGRLVNADQFDPDLCTLNIYFIGNMVIPNHVPQETLFGQTAIKRSQGQVVKRFILVSDAAFLDHGYSESDNFRFDHLVARGILYHEVVCHALTDRRGYMGNGNHPPDVYPPCTKTACISGTYLTLHAKDCFGSAAKITGPPR